VNQTRLSGSLRATIVVLAVLTGGPTVAAEELKVGSLAPEFSLPGSDGRTHTLSEHRGQRAVVLAWFPKAFTGG
jgi:peroxiredoxin Q/BCP